MPPRKQIWVDIETFKVLDAMQPLLEAQTGMRLDRANVLRYLVKAGAESSRMAMLLSAKQVEEMGL